MSGYKYSSLHKDKDIRNIQRETQDNFMSKSDGLEKADKVSSLITLAPVLTDLTDGQEKVYDDGTNVWIYKRVSSRLFKVQLTEV
jgi:hypothetical protein